MLKKPDVPRTPVPPSPELLRLLAKKSHTGRAGLLVSLGIHACLIAAAFWLPFVNLKGGGATSPVATEASADFESTPVRSPRVSEPQPSSQAQSRPAFAAAPLRVTMPLNVIHMDLDLPASTPILTPVVTQDAGPEAAPTAAPTGSSARSVSPGRPAVKAGSGKSSNPDRPAKRDTPIPPPKLLHAPPPRYPAAAKAAKISGKVAVLVMVRGNGSAASTRLYHGSGNAALDQAAVDAAHAWTFSPTPSLVGGKTIAVIVNITFAL